VLFMLSFISLERIESFSGSLQALLEEVVEFRTP